MKYYDLIVISNILSKQSSILEAQNRRSVAIFHIIYQFFCFANFNRNGKACGEVYHQDRQLQRQSDKPFLTSYSVRLLPVSSVHHLYYGRPLAQLEKVERKMKNEKCVKLVYDGNNK